MRSVRPHERVLVIFNGGYCFGVVRPHVRVLMRSVRPHGKVLVSHKFGEVVLASFVRLSVCPHRKLLVGYVRPHRKVLVRSDRPHGEVLVSHKLEDILSVCIERYL